MSLDTLRQDPLEAILVILGRSFSIFFGLKGLGKYQNDNTFVHMRNSGHLGDGNMSEKTPCFFELNFLTNRHKQKRFCRIKEEGQIYIILPQIFKVLPRLF